MPVPASSEALVVLFVTIDEAHADTFARTAVEQRLVACVNLVPGARSIYRWKGEVCEDHEVLLWMETREAGAKTCIEALAALHPYDTPKIIALPACAVHEPYRAWCIAHSGGPIAPE
ncbi:MAG: divalent-cation tolerance protein CutA [Nannocystaceae bacterium]|nr:divalent-cation tolerance protein CutA [Nannocystaceae bacterium]